jgi:lysozyme
MKASQALRTFIKCYETCWLEGKRCPAGVPTWGWGHTGKDVVLGGRITQEQADRLFDADLASFERDVSSLVKVQLTQSQFDALVSYAFNVGSDIDADTVPEGLGDSTLLRKLNAGDYAGAAAQFPLWNKAKGKVLNGLTKRRLAERDIFLHGKYVNHQ